MLARVVPLLLTGCVSVELPFEETIAAEDVALVWADVESGDLRYGGGSEDTLTVTGTSRGTAASRTSAEIAEEGNSWRVEVVDGVLELVGTSERGGGEVDFLMEGPSVLDLDLLTENGSAYLEDVEGSLVVTAEHLVADDITGDAWLAATTGGIDASIQPWEGGTIELSAVGATVLALPWGLDYNLEVWGTEGEALEIADLGFDYEVWGDGYYSGEAGLATIMVTVYVTNGSFTLEEY